MTDLIAIAYDQTWQADQAMALLQKMANENKIDMANATVVVRDTAGKASYRTAYPVVPDAGSGALLGGMWGVLLGALFAPFTGGASAAAATLVAGTGLGAVGGAAIGALSEADFDDEFTAQLETQMRPGTSALMVVVDGVHVRREEVLETLRPFGGTVIKTNLTQEAEAKLQKALQPAA
jgi:uncharacterized membrane protein